MNNLTPQLTDAQLRQNIDALQSKGLSTNDVQAYVNNYKKGSDGNFILSTTAQNTTSQDTSNTTPYSGAMGTNPNDSLYGKVIDNSVTRGIQDIFPGKQVGKAIGTLGGYAAAGAADLTGTSGVVQTDTSKLSPEAITRLQTKGVPITSQGSASNYDTSAPSPLQVAGDVAAGALTVAAPNVGTGGTALTRIAANTILGETLGGANALSEGKTNVKDIAKSAVTGGALSGGVSAATEGVGYLIKNAPLWFTKSALPKIKDSSVPYALDNTTISSPTKLLKNSNTNVADYSNQIDTILKDPKYVAQTGVSSDVSTQIANQLKTAKDEIASFPKSELDSIGGVPKILEQAKTNLVDGLKELGSTDMSNKIASIDISKFTSIDQLENAIKTRTSLVGDVLSQFPNAQLNDNKVISILKQVAPNNKALVDKVVSGEATLIEQNALRQELDLATKKAYTDKPTMTFAKNIGKSLADVLRNNVQTSAPETAPIFKEFSKELDLNNALKLIVKKNNLKPTFGDLTAAYAGYKYGGIKGSIEAIAAERLLGSTAGKLAAAKGIQTLGKSAPVVNAAIQGLKAPIIKKLTK